MSTEQHTFHSVTIEVVTVLLASIISLSLSATIGVKTSALPFVMVVCYVILKALYHLCVALSARIIDLGIMFHPHSILSRHHVKEVALSKSVAGMADDNHSRSKLKELFHYEYQQEQQQYLLKKEREADEKLRAVLQYTRKTFERLEFNEEEVFQICESVRYLVTNQQILATTETHIRKRAAITQISLKNFAWNIAFQYNINGDVTAQFVMHTFNEWFCNSTIETIRKNLRTTSGRHKIEIDENIIFSSLSNNQHGKNGD